MLHYISTRDQSVTEKTFEDVVLDGLAPDGGLYVPTGCPLIEPDELKSLQNVPYIGVAHRVILPFVEGCIDSDELYQLLERAYKDFQHQDIAPLVELKDNLYLLELFHGPTLAFKDMALQFLGQMFDHVLHKQNRKLTIVGATSGDTGSAAIEACKDKDSLDVFMLHPHGRVSDVQRRQMTTVLSDNIHNIALEGSFDDCQDLVKAMFNDAEFRQDMQLSAVNSINWGRIVAQVAYYVFAYLKLSAQTGAEKVAFSVPTGNFGNIYAGYIASSMGVPTEKLLIGTNSNDILFRFLQTGCMQTSDVVPTLSPSMDIQISSNFERVLFDLMGRDAEALTGTMIYFRTKGPFSLDNNIMSRLRELFSASRFDDAQTMEMTQKLYQETRYVADPHSIIGVGAAEEYLKDHPDTPVISMATAHPAKFPDAIMKSTGTFPDLPPHLADLHEREERMTVLPNDLEAVKNFIRKAKA